MPEVVLRPPTLADAEAAADCINRSARARKGRDEVSANELRGWWTQPAPFDLERSVVLAAAGARVVGYGDIGDAANDGAVLWLDVRGEAQEPVLVELERRALERRAPDGLVRAMADAANEPYRSLLASRGYEIVRSSYRMQIELDSPPVAPDWPEECTVRRAVADVDEPLLHRLTMESFADHWGFTPSPYADWLHWLHAMGVADPDLWLVAETKGEAVGLVLCRPADHGDPDCGWVSVLGVLPARRGLGLGSALLREAFVALAARGRRRVALGVDADNTTGAVRLYERAGMRVVERSDSWELRR